jgi:hypothetical protein
MIPACVRRKCERLVLPIYLFYNQEKIAAEAAAEGRALGLIGRTQNIMPTPFETLRFFMLIKSISRVAIFTLPLVGLAPGEASAISVEVAKKCDSLVAKAFPPREPGNPAAGSAKGTAQQQRDYFNKCVTNGGNMDDAANKSTK